MMKSPNLICRMRQYSRFSESELEESINKKVRLVFTVGLKPSAGQKSWVKRGIGKHFDFS